MGMKGRAMKTRSQIALFAVASMLAGAFPALAQTTSSEQIVFGRVRGDSWDLFAIAPDGTGRTRLTNSPTVAEENAEYSPDGSRIAFTNYGHSGTEIHIMDADGSNVVKLTKGPLFKAFARWSPDGTKLLYQGSTDLETDAIIFTINADGTGKARLTPPGRINTHAEWSPDGTKIAYSHSTHGSSDIYFMNSDGTGKTQLTDSKTFEFGTTWSPDGSEIVFSRYRLKLEDYDLLAVDLQGVEREIAGTEDLNEQFPRYSPDGTMLSFLSCQGTTCSIEVMNADGSDRRTIVDNGVEGPIPVWSPDSTRLAYSQLVGSDCCSYDAFVVTVSDGSVVRVTDTRPDEYVYDWRMVP
jgi:Tol biopolymer transport system component